MPSLGVKRSFISANAELVSASDTITYVARQLGSTERARRMLEKWLKDGDLFAVCSTYVTEHDLLEVSTTVPVKEHAGIAFFRTLKSPKIHLGPAFFTSLETSSYDKILWKWEHNIFVSVEPHASLQKYNPDGTFVATPRFRHVAYDVKFDLSVIRAYVDVVVGPERRALLDCLGEPKAAVPTDYNWEQILREFSALAAAGKLEAHFGSWTKRGTQAKFEDIIRVRMTETKADTSTIRRKVKELMKADKAARSTSTPDEPS